MSGGSVVFIEEEIC